MNYSKNYRQLKTCISIIFFLVLNGCAALTIDVDVYKGPLANNEDVLAQQTAVMAIGAKPLLIQLRNKLEKREFPNSEDNAKPDVARNGCLSKWAVFRAKPNYRSGIIPDGSYKFCSGQAAQINSILSLYDNRQFQDPILTEDILIVKKSITDYFLNDSILSPNQGQRNKLQKVWQSYDKICCDKNFNSRFGLEDIDGIDKDDIKEKVEKLRKAYESFLSPKRNLRDIGGIFSAHKALRDSIESNSSKDKIGSPLTDLLLLEQDKIIDGLVNRLANSKDESHASATSKFKALADNDLLIKNHADILFGDGDSSQKSQFIQNVNSAAQSFNTTRETVQSLLRSILRLTNQLSRGESSVNNKEFLEDVPSLINKLLSPRYTIMALHQGQDDKSIRLLWNDLKENLRAVPGLKNEGGSWKKTFAIKKNYPKKVDAFMDALIEQIKNSPFEVAQTLLLADEMFTKSANKDQWRSRFGIAKGPIRSRPAIKAAAESAKTLLGKVSGSLGGGRLDAGLDQLIERFLNTTERNTSLAEKDRARHLLFDALARFAQKVLVIGNNATLFGKDNKISSYIQVLQAVGNSITVQVDELQKQWGYDQRQSGAQSLEALSRQQGLDLAGNKISLKGGDKAQNSKQVLDEFIKSLRYELIAQIRDKGEDKPEVKNLKKAIKSAEEVRAGMVRLRPASAYLRTSFPSTSLQEDGATVWENLLTKFGMRSIPLLGTAVGDNKVKTQQEIDKQFWQSINRIQLSAAGNTNYVLMKDDIGNWTVKNMSADPKDIIKSAKNLALFGAGGALGADMTSSIRGTDASGNEFAKPEPLLKRQLNKFEKIFKKKAQEDLIALVKGISGNEGKEEGLEDFIKTGWKELFKSHADKVNIIEALEKELDVAARDEEYKEKTKKAPLTPTKENNLNPANDFITRLNAVNSFYNRAKKAIQKSDRKPINNQAEIKTKAIASLSQNVHDFVAKHNQRRMSNVAQFNTQVTVLSESIKPEEKPKKP